MSTAYALTFVITGILAGTLLGLSLGAIIAHARIEQLTDDLDAAVRDISSMLTDKVDAAKRAHPSGKGNARYISGRY